MLKYCSVTVRGENKEAVERIEREHVPFPGCETQWEGETKGELYRPNKTCVTAWGAVTCISSISSTGDTSSVSVRDVTVSVKLLVLFILQHKSARVEKKNPIVFCIFDSVRHRKQRSCNSITKLLESLVLFSRLLGKLFSVHCSMIAGSENPYAVLFYADADRKEGSENQFLRQHRVAL